MPGAYMNDKAKAIIAMGLAALISLPMAAQAGWNPLQDDNKAERSEKAHDVQVTIDRFKRVDPGLKVFFDKAYGYAVFPTIGKGGMGIGGAYGEGVVFEQGRAVGDTSMTQVTFGFQFGGQAYSELIFFKDKTALDKFRTGNFEFSAQASAVAVKAGASATTDYDNGVAVFTQTKGGLMYEATLGGQKFGYTAR